MPNTDELNKHAEHVCLEAARQERKRKIVDTAILILVLVVAVVMCNGIFWR